MQLDRDISESTALVVDSNPMSRSVLTKHPRGFGFGTVKQVRAHTLQVLDAATGLPRNGSVTLTTAVEGG